MIESDGACAAQLLALSNPQAAHDLASDAGNRNVAFATVVSTTPLVLNVDSRRIVDGSRVVMLVRNGNGCVDAPGVHVDVDGGYFKIDGLVIGPLSTVDVAQPRLLLWEPKTSPVLDEGDRIVRCRLRLVLGAEAQSVPRRRETEG